MADGCLDDQERGGSGGPMDDVDDDAVTADDMTIAMATEAGPEDPGDLQDPDGDESSRAIRCTPATRVGIRIGRSNVKDVFMSLLQTELYRCNDDAEQNGSSSTNPPKSRDKPIKKINGIDEWEQSSPFLSRVGAITLGYRNLMRDSNEARVRVRVRVRGEGDALKLSFSPMTRVSISDGKMRLGPL